MGHLVLGKHRSTDPGSIHTQEKGALPNPDSSILHHCLSCRYRIAPLLVLRLRRRLAYCNLLPRLLLLPDHGSLDLRRPIPPNQPDPLEDVRRRQTRVGA